jgi:hypothetical protein
VAAWFLFAWIFTASGIFFNLIFATIKLVAE